MNSASVNCRKSEHHSSTPDTSLRKCLTGEKSGKLRLLLQRLAALTLALWGLNHFPRSRHVQRRLSLIRLSHLISDTLKLANFDHLLRPSRCHGKRRPGLAVTG